MIAMTKRASLILGVSLLALVSCTTKPVAGPDKTFAGEAVGAAQGAGSGAVIGFQVGAGTGPGAIIGAGFGAVAGALSGAMDDLSDEQAIKIDKELRSERSRAIAQQKLADHYKRRVQLHPTRDIFPADLFFDGDSAKMCPSGRALVKEIAKINKYRLPYSRIAVAVYAKSLDATSTYALRLTEQRSKEFVNQMVREGIDPRRLETRPVVITEPLLLDPLDNPTRYNQAVEIIPIDR